MKTIGKILLAAAALLSLLTVSAFAEEGLRLELSSAEAAPGSTVSVTIAVVNNPGYAGFDMAADYDRNVLELTQFTLERVTGALSSASVKTGMATFATLRQKTGDGVIATLTFRVRDDAPAGATAVGVTDVDFFTIDEDEIAVETVYGGVFVTGAGAPADREPSTPAPAAEEAAAGELPGPAAGPEPSSAPAPASAPDGEEEGIGELPSPGQERPDTREEPVVRELAEAPVPPETLEQAGIDPARTAAYEIQPPAEDEDGGSLGFAEVTAPYPAAAPAGSYVYRVYMLGEDGTVEELPAAQTEEGLSVLTDASYPLLVSWMTPEEAEAMEAEVMEAEAAAGERPDEAEPGPSAPPEAAAEASEAGDARPWALIPVGVCAAAAAAFLIYRARRKRS